MPSVSRKVLFIVTGDPRQSARPAEAIRVAAGLSAWGRAEIRLYLRGPAVYALSEYPEELVDEESYVRYLPLIAEGQQPVWVQRGAPGLRDLGEAVLTFEAIDDAELAVRAARHDILWRF